MTQTEQPYNDREITIRDRETVKLSELTKDERDIYFAGVDEGEVNAWSVIIFCMLIIFAIVGCVSLILWL